MTHHELCLLAAEWLHNSRGKNLTQPTCKWVAVELVCVGGACRPDVFGWGDGIGCGFAGVQIEVKMSRGDFLKDRRKTQASMPQYDLGFLKYYCCPEGIIHPDDLSPETGLLYESGGSITVVKEASGRRDKSPSYEVPFIASVMRRIEVKPQIFVFKKD